MNYLNLTVAILVGYIVGSIPWALIVGKVFYGVDVRKHGSGNLGGTNVLRTLGKVPGISVMVLDALKALLFMAVLHLLKMDDIVPFAGLAVLIGHCFPVFANFKGGKAVASAVGYVLAVNLFVEKTANVVLAFTYADICNGTVYHQIYVTGVNYSCIPVCHNSLNILSVKN